MRAHTLMSITVLAVFLIASNGCYEDTGATTPQAQTPAPVQKEGPITSMGNQPASSALGKAKRSASNVAEQAEAKSREIAEHADDPLNDHPKPAPAPAPTPTEDPG